MFNDILSSRFYAYSVTLTRFIGLVLLFLLFSLPLITFGASSAALIASIRQSDYPAFQIFWKTFKENIIRATVVMVFTIFTIMFLYQLWQIADGVPMGNLLLLLFGIILIVYNLNAYLFVSILKKCNIIFFRQVFFFTIGTLYKTFLVPIIAFGLTFVFAIINGWGLIILGIPIVISIYVRMIKNDIETALEATIEQK